MKHYIKHIVCKHIKDETFIKINFEKWLGKEKKDFRNGWERKKRMRSMIKSLLTCDKKTNQQMNKKEQS